MPHPVMLGHNAHRIKWQSRHIDVKHRHTRSIVYGKCVRDLLYNLTPNHILKLCLMLSIIIHTPRLPVLPKLYKVLVQIEFTY